MLPPPQRRVLEREVFTKEKKNNIYCSKVESNEAFSISLMGSSVTAFIGILIMAVVVLILALSFSLETHSVFRVFCSANPLLDLSIACFVVTCVLFHFRRNRHSHRLQQVLTLRFV